MSKITTADCKRFLVAEVARRPEIVTSIYGSQPPTDLVVSAMKESKWVRREKFKPTGDHYRVEDRYDLWYPAYGHRNGSAPADRLSTIRTFYLAPDVFEDTVGFMVLEDLQGNLILGEYIGD